jgi:hypothetical protein
MTRKEFAKIIGDVTEKHWNSKCDCCKNGDDIDMNVLLELESLGMGAPELDGDRSKAMTEVRVYPIYNMWADDFDKDEKLVKAYQRILTKKKK